MSPPSSTKVKHLLLDAGISGAEIGRRLGVSRQTVADVISGRKPNPRIRAAIAEACGVTVESLWGAGMVDMYATEGEPATPADVEAA